LFLCLYVYLPYSSHSFCFDVLLLFCCYIKFLDLVLFNFNFERNITFLICAVIFIISLPKQIGSTCPSR